MKCISLHQPWASLVVYGKKRVETRSWPTTYRGPLLIHASSKWDGAIQSLCLEAPFRDALANYGVPIPPHSWTAEDVARRKAGWGMPFGAIIGRVNLIDCFHTQDVAGDDLGAATAPYTIDRDALRQRKTLFISNRERAFGDYSTGRYAFLFEKPEVFEKPIKFSGLQRIFNVDEKVLARVA